MKKITIMISTYSDRVKHAFNISQRLPKGVDVVISHQTEANSQKIPKQVIYAPNKTKGISSNRNYALKFVNEGIGVIGDDDLVYLEGFEQRIINAYKKRPGADIIIFKIKERSRSETGKLKKFSKFRKTSISAVGLTMNVSAIKKANLCFDESFNKGEENVFISDALRAGLSVYTCDHSIVSHPHDSSGQKLDLDSLKYKVDLFERTHGWYGPILAIIYFSLFKKTNMTFRQKFLNMVKYYFSRDNK